MFFRELNEEDLEWTFFHGSHSVVRSVRRSVRWSVTQCEIKPKSDIPFINAPAHPYVTDAVVYTLFFLGSRFSFLGLFEPQTVLNMFLFLEVFLTGRSVAVCLKKGYVFVKPVLENLKITLNILRTV